MKQCLRTHYAHICAALLINESQYVVRLELFLTGLVFVRQLRYHLSENVFSNDLLKPFNFSWPEISPAHCSLGHWKSCFRTETLSKTNHTVNKTEEGQTDEDENVSSLHAFALIPHKTAYCMREYKSFFSFFVQKVSHIVNEVCSNGVITSICTSLEEKCIFPFLTRKEMFLTFLPPSWEKTHACCVCVCVCVGGCACACACVCVCVCDQHQASGRPREEGHGWCCWVVVDNWWWPAVPVVIMYECLFFVELNKHSHSSESYHTYRYIQYTTAVILRNVKDICVLMHILSNCLANNLLM